MPDKPDESPSLSHRTGVAVDGVYQGTIRMAAGLGTPIDWINSGLRRVGVPVSDKPVGGSEWIRENLSAGYNGYNNAIGHTPPKPVDRTDRIIHATADLAGQTIIPVAAAAARANAATTGIREIAQRTADAGSHANRVSSSTAEIARAASDASDIASTRTASAASSIGVKGISTGVDMRGAFATASATASVATADLGATLQQRQPAVSAPGLRT